MKRSKTSASINNESSVNTSYQTMKSDPEGGNCGQRLIQLVQEYKSKCIMSGSSTGEVCDRIIENAFYAGQIAPHFDFRDIKCNGIRSILKYAESYFEIGLKKCTDVHFAVRFTAVINAMDLWLSAIVSDVKLDFTECTVDQQESFYNKIFHNDESVVQVLLSQEFHCITMPGMRTQSDMILRLLVLLKINSLHQVHKPLSFRSKTLARHASEAVPHLQMSDFNQFFSFISSSTVSAAAVILRSMIAIRKSVSAKEYCIRVPHTHQLVVDKEKMSVSVHSCRISEANVKIRILRRRGSKNPGNKLLIYVHGGAFMLPSTIAAENVYLKDVTYSLNGPPVLSVCMTITQFPVGMQQLLDTYLWLISDDPHVRQVLGFQPNPNEIIFSGDSSGGNQVLSLLVLLNELSLPRPRSIVVFFPKTSLQRDVFPSLLLSQFDSFAHKALLSAGCLAYVPIVRKLDDGSVEDVPDTNHLPLAFVVDFQYVLIESCILSPVRYAKLHELRDVSLHILALENDPLLDESIQLAKRWHGPVHLECMESVAHGAFLFHYSTRPGRECVKLASEMLQRAFSE